MKLDSSLAWKDAVTSISANREVLAAIAGVFFLLPSLALALFAPEPEPVPNMTPEQAMALMSDFYLRAAPFIVLMSVLQAVGVLAILTLCTDLARPTVGEALKRGMAGLLPYVASSLIMGLGFVLAGSLVGAIAVATGIAALVVVVVTALLVAIAYCAVRLSLAAPVVAVERVRNPFTVLTRSWALTKGNAGRIGLLIVLVFVVFMVVVIAVSAVVGVTSVLLFGAGVAKTIEAVLSSFLGAGFTATFVALLAAIHRQLAGDAPRSIAITFD